MSQVNSYLVNFPHLKATEAAGCEGHIKEKEIWEVLKKVGKNNSGHQLFTQRSILETVAHVCSLVGNSLQPLDGTGNYSPRFH